MEKRMFKSLEKILNSINQEQIEIEVMKNDLRNKSKGKIQNFFSPKNYEKQQFKLYKNETKRKIKSGMESIKNKESYLDRFCTFDFDIITQFLADTLSIIEREEYQITDLELEDTHLNVALFVATKVPLSTTDYESVCLITTKENTKLVSDMYDDDEFKDSNDIQTTLEDEDGKYILLESSDTYTIFDYSKQQIPEELTETYPYLPEIIVDLISLRLENPNLSDKQSTNIMLQQIPKRYSHLIGNSKKVKTKTKN